MVAPIGVANRNASYPTAKAFFQCSGPSVAFEPSRGGEKCLSTPPSSFRGGRSANRRSAPPATGSILTRSGGGTGGARNRAGEGRGRPNRQMRSSRKEYGRQIAVIRAI